MSSFSGKVIPSHRKDYLTTEDVIGFSTINSYQIGVLADGHGTRGRESALFCVKKVQEKMVKFLEQKWTEVEIADELKNVFKQVHMELSDHPIFQKNENGVIHIHGGTTLTVLIVGKDEKGQTFIVSANVGDSDAFVFSENYYEILTTSHDPQNEEEYKRVSELKEPKGDFIYQTHGAYHIRDYVRIYDETGTKIEREKLLKYNDPKNGLYFSSSTVRGDISSYFVYEGKVHLAITRAIGDFYAHEFGMTYEPSIKIFYPKENQILFLASDGILDCYHYEELSRLLLENKIDEELEKIFKQKAYSLFGSRHDDLSFIRLKLE
jgi:serine/threonine protein phosphatase PrpC